jgi:glycine cleavage system protein P-like pyridoxal-binding family
MTELSRWLVELTGMAAVALSPKAGAHGELCGMMAIKQALIARGEAGTRTRVLAPESAHGTNPATAAQCGFSTFFDQPHDSDRFINQSLCPESPHRCGGKALRAEIRA